MAKFKQMAKFNTLLALTLLCTNFVTDLMNRKKGATVSKIIQQYKYSEYSVWLKCKEGIYPVQTCLYRIDKAPTPNCPHCSERVGETLTRFACVCPSFDISP
jgi:hypothetical protein